MVLKMLRSRRRRKMTRLRRRKLRRPRPSQSPLNQFVLMESSKILRYHRLKDPRYLEKLSLVKMLREELSRIDMRTYITKTKMATIIQSMQLLRDLTM